ncbi:transcriptional regulator, ArsR family [Novosphingobium sp. B1]|nr:transcriptional regulator, ArsR family [Novosphingobium sp. B1]
MHTFGAILNHMVQYESPCLDVTFSALSDATRRGVVLQLGEADASISDLASRFGMTLPGMSKHVAVLEEAGLVVTQKVGRVRKCRLGPGKMEEAAAWLERYRQMWDARFSSLDVLLEDLKRREKADEQPDGQR